MPRRSVNSPILQSPSPSIIATTVVIVFLSEPSSPPPPRYKYATSIRFLQSAHCLPSPLRCSSLVSLALLGRRSLYSLTEMAAMKGVGGLQVLLSAMLLVCLKAKMAFSIEAWAVTDWGEAHATFYGGQDASGTMGGACGYGNLYSLGYGVQNTALSNGLLNNGLTCGACFQIVCQLDGSKWCYPGSKSITVTATNACPPGSEGGWCDPPRLHFDLSYPMFTQLAQAVAGVIPVKYKRVPCQRQGGIRFTLHGNPWFDYVLVHNVASMGAVCGVSIKGERSGWYYMSQNWGQFWSASANLVGQALSFQVRLCNGNTQEFYNVAAKNWGFGQTYEADGNFY